MQLVDFTTYVEAAEKLINENPLGLKRVALVSSEDPWVIHEASRLTRLDSGAADCLSCNGSRLKGGYLLASGEVKCLLRTTIRTGQGLAWQKLGTDRDCGLISAGRHCWRRCCQKRSLLRIGRPGGVMLSAELRLFRKDVADGVRVGHSAACRQQWCPRRRKH